MVEITSTLMEEIMEVIEIMISEIRGILKTIALMMVM